MSSAAHDHKTQLRSDLMTETRRLAEAIERLRALLEHQRDQIDSFEETLYPDTPGGAAARRLMALKRRSPPN